MKQRKLGCLTTGGLVAFVVTLVFVGASYAFTRSTIFSPGPLNAQSSGQMIGGVESHSELEKECAACHPAPWDRVGMAARCVECHLDLLEQLVDLNSLHGAVMADMGDLNCRECHTEHHGADANLTKFLEGDFPHELVGFSLKAHSQISWEREIVCADCHQSGFTNFNLSSCDTCHEQVNAQFSVDHQALWGIDCLACHDGFETYGADFDHGEFAFKLEYLHTNIACQDCHPGASSAQMLQETGQACEDCHQKDDVHETQMGNQCGVCHIPKGWRFGFFDHTATGFLLEKGHDKLECLSCHRDSTYQGNDPACISCHAQDEPHSGQFGIDCAACHTISRWDEIIFDHSAVIAQDCNLCHLVDRPSNHFPGVCSACHSTNAWKPASFDHGVAGATDCIACHTGDRPRDHYTAQCSACHSTNAWKPANFDHSAAGATNCQSCHTGNRPNNHFSGQCSMCHSTKAWKPASFNHSFPMNHKGANQQCQLCHPGNNYNSYTCYGCHEHNQSKINEKHKEVKNFNNNCVRCHANGGGGGDD